MKQMKISELYSQINSGVKIIRLPEFVIYHKDQVFLYNKITNEYYLKGTKIKLFKWCKSLNEIVTAYTMTIPELLQYNNDLIEMCNRSRECRSDLYNQLNELRDYIKKSEYLKNSTCSEEIEKFLEGIENDIDNL